MTFELELLRTDAIERQSKATTTIWRGVVLISLIPLVIGAAIIAATVSGASATLFILLLASLYCVVGGLTGIAMIGVGALSRRAATKELRELDEQKLLPEARVVVR